MKTEWMTVPEAGREFFKVGQNVAYALARQGMIPTIKVGGRFRVERRMMEEKMKEITGPVDNRDKKLAEIVRADFDIIVFALRGMSGAEGLEDTTGWTSEQVSTLANRIYSAARDIN